MSLVTQPSDITNIIPLIQPLVALDLDCITILVHSKTMANFVVTDVCVDYLVRNLKEMIYILKDIKVERQYLFLNDIELNDKQSIRDSGIVSERVVYLKQL